MGSINGDGLKILNKLFPQDQKEQISTRLSAVVRLKISDSLR